MTQNILEASTINVNIYSMASILKVNFQKQHKDTIRPKKSLRCQRSKVHLYTPEVVLGFVDVYYSKRILHIPVIKRGLLQRLFGSLNNVPGQNTLKVNIMTSPWLVRPPLVAATQ